MKGQVEARTPSGLLEELLLHRLAATEHDRLAQLYTQQDKNVQAIEQRELAAQARKRIAELETQEATALARLCAITARNVAKGGAIYNRPGGAKNGVSYDADEVLARMRADRDSDWPLRLRLRLEQPD